jgi:hypothetical protein
MSKVAIRPAYSVWAQDDQCLREVVATGARLAVTRVDPHR